jgi:NADPH:quinone reductase-like Zn-dependent oxidoreductase
MTAQQAPTRNRDGAAEQAPTRGRDGVAGSMTAIVADRYGPIEGLASREIDRPLVGDGEVLVRVQAAGLNIADVFGVRGSPFPVRVVSGLRRPKYGVPGHDLAGVVEEVGAGVSGFMSGDEVFGDGRGTCAEYAAARADRLAPRPACLTPEEAAATVMAGLAALHGLRAGKLRAGQKVLVNGASGGVGSFAVQIAKSLGAEVTGVTSTGNVDLVRSLGADHVIDYTRADFTLGDVRYDLILDNVENRSLSDLRRVLTPNGTLILNSGTGASGIGLLGRMVWPLIRSVFARQKMRRFFSTPNRADLEALARLAEQGKLRPVIDRTCPLSETRAALGHVATGHARGKVVVIVPA